LQDPTQLCPNRPTVWDALWVLDFKWAISDAVVKLKAGGMACLSKPMPETDPLLTRIGRETDPEIPWSSVAIALMHIRRPVTADCTGARDE